eukprot:4719912-Karenia_brevis.AAC.1
MGNDFADFLATQGADQHVLDPEMKARVLNIRFLTSTVQTMMLEIVTARNAQSSQMEEPELDTVSDDSDSIEIISSDSSEDCVEVLSVSSCSQLDDDAGERLSAWNPEDNDMGSLSHWAETRPLFRAQFFERGRGSPSAFM